MVLGVAWRSAVVILATRSLAHRTTTASFEPWVQKESCEFRLLVVRASH